MLLKINFFLFFLIFFFLKTQFDPLGCYQDQEDETLNEEDTNAFLSSLQEQQNNIKQMVVTNMNVAYRQEKKNAKRKARNMPSITLTVTDPLFSTEETPSAKKLKESLYLSFPVETVLTTVQNVPEAKKNGLEYPLTDSDVH